MTERERQITSNIVPEGITRQAIIIGSLHTNDTINLNNTSKSKIDFVDIVKIVSQKHKPILLFSHCDCPMRYFRDMGFVSVHHLREI